MSEKRLMEKANEENLRRLLLISFVLSGMTALIYEVVWTRPLQLIFGSTIYAVSTMLTAFMVGFTLGSYSFRNKADESKNPLLLFAKLELGIGVYGLVILLLFKLLPSIYLSLLFIPGFQFVQFLVCFAILIIPTTLMGATWPVVNKAYVAEVKDLGRDVGTLYSFNSLGSTLGPISAGFLLIPLIGIAKTSFLATSLNLLIAFSLFSYWRAMKK